MRDFLERLVRNPRACVEFIVNNDFSISYTVSTIKDKLLYPFVYLYERIKHVIIWLPIIWQDRDWDSEYLMRIMEYKLLSMVEYFNRYGYGVDNDKCTKQMLFCARVLRRLIDDVHCKSEFEKFYKEYPIDWLTSSTENGERVTNYTLSDKERIEFERLLTRKDNQVKSELRDLFDCMRVHIQYWWD